MKRILRNASLLVITLIFMFSVNTVVNATCKKNSPECDPRYIEKYGNVYVTGDNPIFELREKYDPETTWTEKHFVGPNPYGAQGDNWHYINSELGVTKNGGNGSNVFSVYADKFNNSLYCLDAHAPGDKKLFAKRFLVAEYDDPLDNAFMSILTTGSNTVTNGDNASIRNYWAKLLALRAVVTTFSYTYNVTDASFANDGILINGTTYKWLAENKDLYNKLITAIPSNNVKVFDKLSAYSSHYFSGGAAETAKQLYYTALNKAIEVANNTNGTKAEVKSATSPAYKEIEETVNSYGDTIVSEDIIHTITVKGLTRDGATLIINDPTLSNATKGLLVGPQITNIKVNDKEFDHSAVGQNLITLSGADFSKEVTIQITVHLEGRKELAKDAEKLDTIKPGEVLKCGEQPIKYDLNIKYDEKIPVSYANYIGIVWTSERTSTSTGATQRYISVHPNPNGASTSTEQVVTLHGETALIPVCDCSDLEDACEIEAQETGNLDGEACEELKESNCGECGILEVECAIDPDSPACDKMYEYCDVTCTTEVSKFDCCDYTGDVAHLIVEGDNIPVNIDGPDNPYGCFVKGINSQKEGATNTASYNLPGYEKVEGTKDDTEKNTYTLTQNKYCVISCKEDYAMSLPTARLVNAGRYFTFKAEINGTKTCYSNTIDIDQFNIDVNDIVKDMETAINNYLKYRTAFEKATSDANGVVKTISGISNYSFTVADKSGLKTVSIGNASSISYTWADDYEAASIDDVRRIVENKDTTGLSKINGSLSEVKSSLENYANYYKSVYEELQDRLEELQVAYDDCSNDSWSSKLHYEPSIYYDYEESYVEQYYKDDKTRELDGVVSEQETERWYCEADSLSGGYEKTNCKSNTDSKNTVTVNSVSCNLENSIDKLCTTVSKDLPNVGYVSESSKINANYKPKVLFYNVHPSGKIETPDTLSPTDDATPIEDAEGNGGLPVSLSTQRGIYKYTINITNLGEFYTDSCKNGECKLGRLIGAEDAVMNADDSRFKDIISNNTASYSCSYLVNIKNTEGWVCDFNPTCTDDCISDCVGPNCDIEICDGVDCVAECIGLGCIYDADAGSSFIERTVTLSSLFPNGTTSPNWDRTKEKAKATIEEIEDKQNGIFETTPVLSIRLTGSEAREIKKYNEEQIKDGINGNNNIGEYTVDTETLGGYSNDTLTCFSLGDYEEVACFSNFIDDVLNGKYGSIVNDNSLIKDDSYRTVGDVSGAKGEYFESWTGTISEDSMVGPAWK